MEIIFVFFTFINGEVAKIPVSIITKPITCEIAVKQITTQDYLPIGVRYKGKQVFAHYCKDKKGSWVK